VGSLPEREALPSGELRVTAPNDLGAIVLAPVLSGFSTRYPAVEIDVRLTNRHVDLVAEGFDAALRISVARLSDSSLVARRLSVLEMQVFAAPTYLARAGVPRAPKDTADHAWVLMRGHKLPPAFPAPTVKPRLVGDDVLFVCRACSAGAGLAVLPTFLAREELAAGRLVRVLPRFSQRSGALYLVHPPARHVARKVTAFRDYLVEHFASYPLVGRAG
jgi:DNA-binding transcriptional LysR family regulator